MKDLLSRPHRYEETMNLFSEVRGYLEDRSSTTCTIDSSIRLLTFQRQILERTAEARNLWLVGLGRGIGLDGELILFAYTYACNSLLSLFDCEYFQ